MWAGRIPDPDRINIGGVYRTHIEKIYMLWILGWMRRPWPLVHVSSYTSDICGKDCAPRHVQDLTTLPVTQVTHRSRSTPTHLAAVSHVDDDVSFLVKQTISDGSQIRGIVSIASIRFDNRQGNRLAWSKHYLPALIHLHQPWREKEEERRRMSKRGSSQA